jgi:hypothetical protein
VSAVSCNRPIFRESPHVEPQFVNGNEWAISTPLIQMFCNLTKIRGSVVISQPHVFNVVVTDSTAFDAACFKHEVSR